MIYVLGVALCGVLVGVDQLTKWLAEQYLQQSPFVIIDGVFEFNFLLNDGAAFGLLGGGRWFFVLLTALILAGMVAVYIKLPTMKREWLYRAAIILVAAGALGNLIDRARQGYVVDFLYFRLINFPLFNAADCFITVGCGLAIVLLLFNPGETRSKGTETVIGSSTDSGDDV